MAAGIEKREAEAGIEPADRGFADPGLTTWLPRRIARKKRSGRLIAPLRAVSNLHPRCRI